LGGELLEWPQLETAGGRGEIAIHFGNSMVSTG
jgi:hypothetical protein